MQTHPINFPTDLTDEEWNQIKSLVSEPKSGRGKRGRPIRNDRRTELRKNRKEGAKELGVSVKTLWAWETCRWEPCASHLERVGAFLDFDLTLRNPKEVRH